MPKTDIISSPRLFTETAYLKTPSDNLAAFERSLSSLVRAWSKYQPGDSLAAERKQDIEWLKSTLRDYRIHIHTSSNSTEFWRGCLEGKHSRRTLSNQSSKSFVQILLKPFIDTRAQQIYELGVQVGWRYARLKDYLLRIRKQRKLEEAQQLQDYQQFFDFIRRKDQTEDTDLLVSFGWARERKSRK